MSTPAEFTPGKTPTDLLDYTFDFSAWMVGGDAIASATVTSAPSGLTISDTLVAGNTVTVNIGGGVAPSCYLISADITTTNGRICQRSAWLPVTQL